ncbi:MAG: hypothetical protein ACQKBW_11735, partial [Puniceicoccales bacterium]
LRYQTENDRYAYQTPYTQLTYHLTDLALAEALEDAGRFLPQIEDYLEAFLDLPTWSTPAHGGDLAVYRGERIVIDLHACQTAWLLATVEYWFADELPDELNLRLVKEVKRRVLTPYLSAIQRGQPLWWMVSPNNWTAVCAGSITGAALALEPDQETRAEYILCASELLERYIDTFSDEGISDEGMNYWTYGFSHFLWASEAIRKSTSNQVDLLADDKVFKISQIPRSMAISGKIYPAFGDQKIYGKPDASLYDFASMRYGLPYSRNFDKVDIGIHSKVRPPLAALSIAPFGSSAPQVQDYSPPSNALEDQGLRSGFPGSQYFVCRPGTADGSGLGIAIHGGNNGVSHNHNDLGSYVVVKDGVPVLLDPGSEVYTGLTFGPTRYQSQMHNSYGHPVPLVADRMQKTGAESYSTVLHADATPSVDSIKLDLTHAYRSDSLLSVTRTLSYQRSASPVSASVRIVDEASFSQPQNFSTALITLGDFQIINATTVMVSYEGVSLYAQVDTRGADFTFIETPVTGFKLPNGLEPKRMGIALNSPLMEPYIAVEITSNPPQIQSLPTNEELTSTQK